jgi:hypothetical protein
MNGSFWWVEVDDALNWVFGRGGYALKEFSCMGGSWFALHGVHFVGWVDGLPFPRRVACLA